MAYITGPVIPEFFNTFHTMKIIAHVFNY
jgi:hypothetical protein